MFTKRDADDGEESDTGHILNPVMPSDFVRSYRERLQRELDERENTPWYRPVSEPE